MKTIITILGLSLSGSVFAWGATGHRVVGEIAEKFLETKVAMKINQIMGNESLARSSTWADEIKSEPQTYSHTYNWHYTTWPTEVHDHTEHSETIETGTLMKSINEQMAVLKDPNQTNEKKQFALRFVVHLVGDLHQPLHVGNGSDQGGNLCKVTYMGKEINLHALWDEGMIDFSRLSFTELARMATENRKMDEVMAARKGTVVDWARESKEFVPKVYPVDVIPSPQVGVYNYCKKEVTPEEMPKLSYAYAYQWMPVVEKRLFEAGVRLAMLLNQSLK